MGRTPLRKSGAPPVRRSARRADLATGRLRSAKSLNPSRSEIPIFVDVLVHDVLNPADMMTAETSIQFDAIGVRIDRLTGHLASAAVSLEPDLIDAAIADALRQAGEALEGDHATLESVSEDASSPVSRRAWVRQGTALRPQPVLTVRVTAAGGWTFVLSIGIPGAGRALAGGRRREPARTRSRHGADRPARAADARRGANRARVGAASVIVRSLGPATTLGRRRARRHHRRQPVVADGHGPRPGSGADRRLRRASR